MNVLFQLFLNSANVSAKENETPIFTVSLSLIIIFSIIYFIRSILKDDFQGEMPDVRNLGSRVVNNYLIPGKDGYILIDTGYSDGFPHFLKKLKEAKINPDQIKYVFLTHAHDDHAGFLNEVLSITNAKVILHPKAVDMLKKGESSEEGGCSSLLAYLFCQILELLAKGHGFPPLKTEYYDRLITIDSEEFHALDLPFQVIETPGHTEDHIVLLKDGIMFCGDAAMNNFPSIKRVIIWIENLQKYKKSWEIILEANPRIICPAHGKPFPTSDLKKYLPYLSEIKLR